MREGKKVNEVELEYCMGTDLVCKDIHVKIKIYGSTFLVKKYFSIRKSLLGIFGKGAQEKLKTLYQIKKERPKVVGGIIVPSCKIYEGMELCS